MFNLKFAVVQPSKMSLTDLQDDSVRKKLCGPCLALACEQFQVVSCEAVADSASSRRVYCTLCESDHTRTQCDLNMCTLVEQEHGIRFPDRCASSGS